MTSPRCYCAMNKSSVSNSLFNDDGYIMEHRENKHLYFSCSFQGLSCNWSLSESLKSLKSRLNYLKCCIHRPLLQFSWSYTCLDTKIGPNKNHILKKRYSKFGSILPSTKGPLFANPKQPSSFLVQLQVTSASKQKPPKAIEEHPAPNDSLLKVGER